MSVPSVSWRELAARAVKFRVWTEGPPLMLAACVVIASLAVPPTRSAEAQSSGEESVEDLVLALRSYKLTSEELPPGYTLDSEQAYGNEAQALENALTPPADPRPAEQHLTSLIDSERIVRLRQVLLHSHDPTAPVMTFNVIAFRTADAAGRALDDPALLTYIGPSDTLTRQDASPAGEGSARYALEVPADSAAEVARGELMAWRHGRVVLYAYTDTPAGQPQAAARMTELAARVEARLASRAMLPSMVASAPSYLPNAERRLQLYQALISSLPSDESFPALNPTSVDTQGNAELLNDVGFFGQGPFEDPRALYERLISRERRILGVTKQFLPRAVAPSGGAGTFPIAAVGLTLYADATGASEAMAAGVPEIAQRAWEEISLPGLTALTESTPMPTLAEQTRGFAARVTLLDGVVVELRSLRWRRGAVELSATVVSEFGADVDELLHRAADRQDAAYVARPLAGY